MTDLNDLLSRLPIDDIAQQVGASPDDVRAAAAAALPTMVAGLAAQTEDEASTEKVTAALEQHDNDLADGTINLSDVDTQDGQKIVGKLFSDEDSVAHGISGAVPAAGVDQGLVKKILPMLAPIVLSYVMGQLSGKKKGGAQASSGGLGDLLGGMLGGGNKSSGGGLGDLLGSVLGGGGKGGDNPLGSILGGILGGK